MLLLDPNDSQELAFTLHKAVRFSGLTLGEICERLKDDYDVELTPSGLSHVIHRGTIRFQRALQILAVCGVTGIEIRKKGDKENENLDSHVDSLGVPVGSVCNRIIRPSDTIATEQVGAVSI